MGDGKLLVLLDLDERILGEFYFVQFITYGRNFHVGGRAIIDLPIDLSGAGSTFKMYLLASLYSPCSPT